MGPPLWDCTKGCRGFWGPRGPSSPDSLLRGAGGLGGSLPLGSPLWRFTVSPTPGSFILCCPFSRLPSLPAVGVSLSRPPFQGQGLPGLPPFSLSPSQSCSSPPAGTGRAPRGSSIAHPPGSRTGKLQKQNLPGPPQDPPKGGFQSALNSCKIRTSLRPPRPEKKKQKPPKTLRVSSKYPSLLLKNPAGVAQDIGGEVSLPAHLRDAAGRCSQREGAAEPESDGRT